MPIHHSKTKLRTAPKNWQIVLSWFFPSGLPRRRWTRNLLFTTIGLLALSVAGMYGVAQWYVHSKHGPTTLGVSFIPDYASYLGVDPQQTMDALIGQLQVKQFRLTSYWSDVETSPGQYNFTQLDWEFAKADAAHAKINLAVGLRQPRYPECHAPTFYDTSKPESQWYPALRAEMTAVIERYKNNPALSGYQIENEYFLKGFGSCNNTSRQRLIDETAMVRRLDPGHRIIIGRSNNDLGYPIGKPTPDVFSISVYQRVWDATVTHRYLQYPFPSWYYAFLAGWQKLATGHDMILGELQAEAWAPHSLNLLDISLAEQNKSFDAARLHSNLAFAKNTGMQTIDLWGAEYWYYRLQVLHDPSLWNAAAQEFQRQ